jgi:plastocyanin
MTRFRLLSVLLVAVCAAFMLGACSSSKSSEPTKTVTNGKITVEGFDSLHFDVGTIKTTAGPLQVTFVNKGGIEHTFTIKDTDLNLKASGGETKSGTVTLQKGTYQFECTIPGHAQAGMKGKIEVS